MFDEMPTNAPYRLLIRARTELEFDRAVLSTAAAIAGTIKAATVVEKLGPALTRALAATAEAQRPAPTRAPSAAKVVAAMRAVTSWEDDWCGTPPRHWPWPRPWPWPWPWPDPWTKPQPDPWSEIDVLRVPSLIAIVELAKLTELGAPIAEIGQELIKEGMH